MYPYFNFFKEIQGMPWEEFERKNFPNEDLWKQACRGCWCLSINDFNVAVSRYKDLMQGKEIIPLTYDTPFNF